MIYAKISRHIPGGGHFLYIILANGVVQRCYELVYIGVMIEGLTMVPCNTN